MSGRGRVAIGLAATAAALAVVGAASAHAYLVRTAPSASGILSGPPPDVSLTFDEAVEPRFAIVSVTDAAGRQQATEHPARSPSNPDTLVVPLRPHLPEGWYLVYWRAISVDGHPVQGAFTFAIGPNEGPASAVRRPEDLGVGDDASPRDRPLADVPDGDDRDRSLRAADRHRPAARSPRGRIQSSSRLDRVRDRLGSRAGCDSGLSRPRNRDRFAPLRLRARSARTALPGDCVRTCLCGSRDLLRPVLRRRAGSRCGSIARRTRDARSRSSEQAQVRSSRPRLRS